MSSSVTVAGPVERMWEIASKGEIETVKRTIEQRYPGSTVTDAYCRDFVAFMVAMVLEPDRGQHVARK